MRGIPKHLSPLTHERTWSPAARSATAYNRSRGRNPATSRATDAQRYLAKFYNREILDSDAPGSVLQSAISRLLLSEHFEDVKFQEQPYFEQISLHMHQANSDTHGGGQIEREFYDPTFAKIAIAFKHRLSGTITDEGYTKMVDKIIEGQLKKVDSWYPLVESAVSQCSSPKCPSEFAHTRQIFIHNQNQAGVSDPPLYVSQMETRITNKGESGANFKSVNGSGEHHS